MSINFCKASVVLVAVSAVWLTLTSCNTAADVQRDNARSFTLAVLSAEKSFESWQSMGYTRDSSWPVFRDAYYSSTDVYLIPADDVESYDWSNQEIYLTAAAAASFIDSFDCTSDERFPCAAMRVFVALLDDLPVYGGLFMAKISPVAIQFPVIYPKIQDGRVILEIRPNHHAIPSLDFVQAPWPSLSSAEWADIADARIKALFEDLEKLKR